MLTLDRHTGKYSFAIPDCHTKLNQYGRLSLLEKKKSYRQFYHSQVLGKEESSPQKGDMSGQDSLSKLLTSRRFDQKRKSVNPERNGRFSVLAKTVLDSPRALKQVKYEGFIKIPTIHNDYHAFASNGGFSRSETGGIFPK